MKRETIVPLAIVISQLWLIALMFVNGPLLGAWCIACALAWVALAAVAAFNPSPAGHTSKTA